MLGEGAPAADHAAVTEEVDTIAPPEESAVEMAEVDRVSDDTAAIELAPDQPEASIEPQSAVEDFRQRKRRDLIAAFCILRFCILL